MLTARCVRRRAFKGAGGFFFLVSLAIVLFAVSARADVAVFDDIIPEQGSVKLRALTTGRLFPEGGRLVTFVVEGKEIGTTLSGGDGYAFYRYEPPGRGVFRLEVRAEDDRAEGVIVSMGKQDSLMVVEVESALIEPSLALNPRPDSNTALKQIAEETRVLYLTSMMGVARARSWLDDHEFPLSAVMAWEDGRFLDTFRDRGITVSAVIASPAVLDQAQGVSSKFSFQETDSGDKMSGWKELRERLRNRKGVP